MFFTRRISHLPPRRPRPRTVHDLAFEVVPQLPGFPSLTAYLHTIVPRAVARATTVIVTSQNTKADVLERLEVNEGKIHVIPEAASSDFSPTPEPADRLARERMGVTGPFILTVGTLEPRKNLERLLEAFARITQRDRDLRLVIVGRRGWMYDSIFERYRSLGLEDSVLFLDRVGDGELQALYRQAEITVYPALYEGFGLPALEAMASGSPLACSGNSALGELVGDAAEVFDPWDPRINHRNLRRAAPQ